MHLFCDVAIAAAVVKGMKYLGYLSILCSFPAFLNMLHDKTLARKEMGLHAGCSLLAMRVC